MNKFKRVLSLALTGAMITGLMMVGASAAEFTDAKDIENNDAVNTMVALGVIKGKDTGAFDPKGNVTRAEMAKMLCVAINGGKEPVLGTKAVPTYTDIDGHWAESYIEYCSSMGYVAGRGDGTFGPNASVTSTEAAKMILTAMGYKSDVSGFTGIDWAINTNSQANQAGLYEDLEDIDTTQPMSREDAAQMLYNALDAKTVDEDNGVYKTSTYTYQDNQTIEIRDTDGKITSKMTVPQTVTADETFGHKYLTVMTYDVENSYLSKVEDDSKGTYTVTLTLPNGSKKFTKVADDFSSLMGEKVKVLYKDTDDVYGVFASGGAVLATGIVDDIEVDAKNNKIKIDGTSFKTDDSNAGATKLYAFNNFADNTSANSLPANGAAEIKVVDLDDDGKIDHIVYTPFTVGKVTYVGSKNITVSNAKDNTSYKFEDDDIYEGVAKNDYVMVVAGTNTVSGDNIITEITSVLSGDITATREDDDTNAVNQFRMDGTWYNVADSNLQVQKNSVNPKAGATVKKAVIVNGFCFFLDTTKSVEVKDYAVVIDAAGKAGLTGTQAKLLFTDGTKKVVDTKYNYSGDYDYVKKTFTTDADTPLVGALVTYDIDDDEYVLTPASNDKDKAGFDSVVSGTYKYEKNGKSTIDKKYIAKDAVVFVDKDNGKYTVITGAELAKLDTDNVTVVSNAYADKDSSTGYETISLAYVTAPNMTSGDRSYGYVVSKISTVKNDDGDLVAQFTLFNGTEDVDVTTSQEFDNAKLADLAKGVIIEYTEDGDAISVEKIYTIGHTSQNLAAITAYNGDDEFSYISGPAEEEKPNSDLWVIKDSSTNKHSNIEIDDDTVILTINVADEEGVAGGELGLANTTTDENYYYANALVIKNGNTALLIVYCDNILEV